MKKPILIAVVFVMGITPLLHSQTTIRVIFGSTTNVRNSYGGTSNTNSMLSAKFSNLRSSDSNSNTGIRWTRSSHFSATYNDRNQTASTQLNRLNTSSRLSGFRNSRNRTNADLGQLYCDWTNGGILGFANQPGAFSVVRNAVLGVMNTTLAGGIATVHEFGHSMNANHGQGHCFGNNRRTLMHGGGCGPSNGNYRNVFSSPIRRFENVITGNNSNNNRQRIRNRRGAASRLQ